MRPPTRNNVAAVVTVSLTREQLDALAKLADSCALPDNATPHDVVGHLVACAIEGVRRPGSWERQWLYSAFGQTAEVR